jgi:hypothetical protein
MLSFLIIPITCCLHDFCPIVASNGWLLWIQVEAENDTVSLDIKDIIIANECIAKVKPLFP